MNYRSLEKGKRKNQYVGERFSLAFDSFIYFTNAMETVSAVICGIFLLLSVGMGIFVAKDLIFHNAVVEGWISTMSFMALGFFGVFALLTIILKYLSVMLNLIFKKQRYLIMDIDLSTDLKYLGKTIEMFQNDPNLQYVNGSRFSKESDTKGRKWYRKITSMGLVFLLKTLFHMKATDAVCGFTFLRKEAAEQLVRESSQDNGWFYTIEFLLRAERDGMKIYDMPVEWQEDYNTTVKVWKTIKNYLIQMYHLKKAFRQEDKLKK